MINKKKEGGFYASKVRLFLNEYGGIPLEAFCKAEKVSSQRVINRQGHPISTKLARLVFLTQSAKNYKRNVQKYFHDILKRAVVTVEAEQVSILPPEWVDPVTIPVVY